MEFNIQIIIDQLSEIRKEQKEQFLELKNENKQIFDFILKTEIRLNQGSDTMDSLKIRIIDLEKFITDNKDNLRLIINEWIELKKTTGKIKDQFLINLVKWVFGLVITIISGGILFQLTKLIK